MPDVWVCEYSALPLYKWYSGSDQTGALPGLTCVKLESKPASSVWNSWLGFGKLLRLLESWPWE